MLPLHASLWSAAIARRVVGRGTDPPAQGFPPAFGLVRGPNRGSHWVDAHVDCGHLILRYSTNISINEIEVPAHTVAFLDARVNETEPKVVDYQTDMKLGQPAAYASRFAPRHGHGGNLMFFDGHVETKPGHQVVETGTNALNRGYAITPQSDVIWTARRDSNPNVGGDN